MNMLWRLLCKVTCLFYLVAHSCAVEGDNGDINLKLQPSQGGLTHSHIAHHRIAEQLHTPCVSAHASVPKRAPRR